MGPGFQGFKKDSKRIKTVLFQGQDVLEPALPQGGPLPVIKPQVSLTQMRARDQLTPKDPWVLVFKEFLLRPLAVLATMVCRPALPIPQGGALHKPQKKTCLTGVLGGCSGQVGEDLSQQPGT